MSPHREEHIDLCAAYALGGLEEADRVRLERHLAEGCLICEEALAEFSDSTLLLAASAPAALPSPLLRQRVLSVVSLNGSSLPNDVAKRVEQGNSAPKVS